MTDATKLAACPFCGGSARWSPTYIDSPSPGIVECSECGIGVLVGGTTADRIAAWNQRSPTNPVDAVGAEGVEEVDRVAWAIGQALIAAWRETDLEAGKALTGEDIRICARAAIAALRAQPVEHDALEGELRRIRSAVFAVLRRHEVTEECFAEVAAATFHPALRASPDGQTIALLREEVASRCPITPETEHGRGWLDCREWVLARIDAALFTGAEQ